MTLLIWSAEAAIIGRRRKITISLGIWIYDIINLFVVQTVYVNIMKIQDQDLKKLFVFGFGCRELYFSSIYDPCVLAVVAEYLVAFLSC